jgi:hypothetical protein
MFVSQRKIGLCATFADDAKEQAWRSRMSPSRLTTSMTKSKKCIFCEVAQDAGVFKTVRRRSAAPVHRARAMA